MEHRESNGIESLMNASTLVNKPGILRKANDKSQEEKDEVGAIIDAPTLVISKKSLDMKPKRVNFDESEKEKITEKPGNFIQSISRPLYQGKTCKGIHGYQRTNSNGARASKTKACSKIESA